MTAPKLPKDVIMMIEKNNPVMAIKTLASDRGISMQEAKALIDAYEEKLIATQNKKIAKIAKKQGLNHTHNSNCTTASAPNTKAKPNNHLNNSVSRHLNAIGYNKPLIPYWIKRITVVLLIVILVFCTFYFTLNS